MYNEEKLKRNWLIEPQILQQDKPKTNCVFFHGFGGSPLDVEPLASSLHNRGHRCEIPIIAGQKDMHLRSSFKSSTDLLGETHQQIQSALNRNLPLILIGFSMGGALSVIHANHFQPAAIVLLAPFFGLNQGRWLWEKMGFALASFCPPLPKFSSGRIACPNGRMKYRAGSNWLSLKAVCELDELANSAATSIASLTMPILWCHSMSDPVADYFLAQERMPAQTEVLSLQQSDHVLLYDHDKEAVIERCTNFIERFSHQELC